MEQIIVKTEMQNNGEILLFYVDENGDNQGGVITTIENIENHSLQLQDEDSSYIVDNLETIAAPTQSNDTQKWLDEDIKRLLVFYTDNKQTFLTGTTKEKHLWTVACKTMLIGKTPTMCEQKLIEIKLKYSEVCTYIKKGVYVKWPYFDLCHQIFQNDESIKAMMDEFENQLDSAKGLSGTVSEQVTSTEDGIVVVRKVNSSPVVDDTVKLMLQLYLKYKDSFQKGHWRRELWDKIAAEIGEDDGEYWQKRFLNYKHHYIRLLEKKRSGSTEDITWQYMELFDRIFEDDVEFHKKLGLEIEKIVEKNDVEADWTETEKTVLAKYCFDCYDEFVDETIPEKFHWLEIGRILNRAPEVCQQKYEQLKNEHIAKYIDGGYDLRGRKPLAILFDNIISKEVEDELAEGKSYEMENMKTAEIDEIVHYIYDNVELFKDPVCYFVCWATIAEKLSRAVYVCKTKWDELVTLYKSILNDKKENPDMQIDWRYIEVFDRIFDYGMDSTLLDGYEKRKQKEKKNVSERLIAKKVYINSESNLKEEPQEDHRTRRNTADQSLKILEYYLKNKDKFSAPRNKTPLWEALGKQIGLNANQCIHKFRQLKQLYTDHLQQEILRPKTPISWPYYALCKKVFGVRSIKSKLKNGQLDSDSEWTESEVKKLVSYFSKHFHDINDKADDISNWESFAKDIGKTEVCCRDKFLELRKSYRKLRTQRSRNPDVKISWPYFSSFERIYEVNDGSEAMDVDELDESYFEEIETEGDKSQPEEDYQCIIVLQDDQELNNIDNAQIIVQANPDHIMEDNIEHIIEDNNIEHIIEENNIEHIIEENNIEHIIEDKNIEHITVDKDLEQIIEVKHMEHIIEDKNMEHIIEDKNMELIIEDKNIEHIIENKNIEVLDIPQTKPNLTKWTRRTKKLLIIHYINYIRLHKGKEIVPKEMWTDIASKMPSKNVISCRKMFAKLKNEFKSNDITNKNQPFAQLMEKVMKLKPKFARTAKSKSLQEDDNTYNDVYMPDDKIEMALRYYLEHIEDFVSPKFEKKYLWTELANFISEPVTKVFNKINYMKQGFNIETEDINGEKTIFGDLLKEIIAKEVAVRIVIDVNQASEEIISSEDSFTDEETEKLLEWYLSNLDKFKNPKFVRSYLWMEASEILRKSALVCSKKMSEIRTQYKSMVKENSEQLYSWRFFDLCQKIYGTGKKPVEVNVVVDMPSII